ncbi:MAG: DUF1254 domain-containing protein [Pseudomonadota bacterium]
MLETLVDAAFEYAYPLFAVAQTRYRAVQDAANPGRHAPDTLKHERHLSDHRARWITTPNNDTLYSNAWLDLSSGPVRIRIGAMPDGRYWSVAFMDAFTNNFAMLGSRLDGTGPLDITLVGPAQRDAVLPGRTIRAPGNDVWLFARCLVDGVEDLANSHAMQDRIEVLAPPGASHAARIAPGQSADPQNFLAVVNELLARNPPPVSEAVLLERWAMVGLRPGAVDAWHDISEDARQAWMARIEPAHARLRQSGMSGRRDIQGWVASGVDIGNFGQNFSLRASVAIGGLGALPPEEAMYFVKFRDAAMQPLDGRHHYILRVPSTGIPADSFWSFSMYEPTADGQRFFAENPIRRYSIGNRTPGLVRNADGSLDMALQHDAPSEERLLANWLPAPAGPFQIALRTYLPRPGLREGSAAMPSVFRRDPQPS